MSRLSRLSRSIAGQRALVTGAASGMGRATAHLFADEGARVVVVDRDADGVAAVVDEIRTAHGPDAAWGSVTDLAELNAIHRLIDEVAAREGRLDILINNAGLAVPGGATTPEEDFETGWAVTLDVNLTAQVRLVRAALALLQAGGQGRIVNIASSEAIVATRGLAAYTASKHGVVGLTKSLAVELGMTGVTVNCICPGPITTAINASIPDEDKAVYVRRRVPLRRYGEPEEVAHMTLSLVLPAASYVNGAVLVVDGGMTIRH